MSTKSNRRDFIRMAAMTGAGVAMGSGWSRAFAAGPIDVKRTSLIPEGAMVPGMQGIAPGAPTGFIPNRMASWWCEIGDLLWPEKGVVDRIRHRADGFAKAGIDTAINFGFHNRFDFANYFGQLHGYYHTVCEELHQRGIRWMDHYSCNHVTRPRNEADFQLVHTWERLAVQLFPDPIAAKHAQYEGHLYQELCEVDLRDGSRGYAKQYQYEAFCHNNPGLHDMHVKYLQRLMKEVPFDGIEVDDMCSYPGNTTCGCQYCRDRFRRDYGHEIPPFTDKSFFGDTSKEMLEWGNYENPVYRDWVRMKSDSVRDHIKLIKETVGSKPLMTCCSDTGPIVLNAVALDLEKMAPYLDFFMLENVGTNIRNVDWVGMDAEAQNQKDIAAKRGNAPAIALSYELSQKGAYLGWSLARFWGASNWSSTLNGRLAEDPAHAIEMEDAISRPNNWEKQYSELPYWQGKEVVECRLVNNRLCRDNGWRDADGHEHWDHLTAWSKELVHHNIGYRFVRAEELADAAALKAETTPLILDGVACVSDRQHLAIAAFVSGGGKAWLALPYGTHDERGNLRARPLSEDLLHGSHKGLKLIDAPVKKTGVLDKLIAEGHFKPVVVQTAGDKRWVVRLRVFEGKGLCLHFMNTGLEATPDTTRDISNIPFMKDIVSHVTDNVLELEIDTRRVPLGKLTVMSPELHDEQRPVTITAAGAKKKIRIDLTGVDIYAVAQA